MYYVILILIGYITYSYVRKTYYPPVFVNDFVVSEAHRINSSFKSAKFKSNDARVKKKITEIFTLYDKINNAEPELDEADKLYLIRNIFFIGLAEDYTKRTKNYTGKWDKEEIKWRLIPLQSLISNRMVHDSKRPYKNNLDDVINDIIINENVKGSKGYDYITSRQGMDELSGIISEVVLKK